MRKGSSIDIIEVPGDLDWRTAPHFCEVVNQTLARPGLRKVIVDLTKAGRVDSSGVAGLLGAWREAARRGAQFALTGVNDRVKRLLNATRLAGVFEIISSKEAAWRGDR
jgi:anti-sigma B factor antagonist